MQRDSLPEIIYSSSESSISRRIGEWLDAGLIRNVVPRIYTSNLVDDLEAVLERNLLPILGKLFPGAVISHRSALELRPTEKQNFYLTYRYTRNVGLLHLRIRLVEGPMATAKDREIQPGLSLATLDRAMLENLQFSRAGRDGERRTVDREVVEQRLLDILRIDGEDGLNNFRDLAVNTGTLLGFARPVKELNKIISALLSTGKIKSLRSPLGIATALGKPYDPFRSDLFKQLFAALEQQRFPERTEKYQTQQAYEDFSFFEAYFSNYIEGTKFAITEAKAIIYQNEFMLNRMGDSHDIKGTYEIVKSLFEMRKTPDSPATLEILLKQRHAIVMRGRPDKFPGHFKAMGNRAGNTTFVEPQLVRGTLQKGFELYQALSHPIAKAYFMMFLVSEIHPFEDGNGRVARIMMNAELVKAGMTKIIIPTVYRDDYLLGLRQLTRKQVPATYIRMMDRAHRFSHQLDSSSFEQLLASLNSSNAFSEPEEGKLVLSDE